MKMVLNEGLYILVSRIVRKSTDFDSPPHPNVQFLYIIGAWCMMSMTRSANKDRGFYSSWLLRNDLPPSIPDLLKQ